MMDVTIPAWLDKSGPQRLRQCDVMKTTTPAHPAMPPSPASQEAVPPKEAALMRLAGRLSHRLNNILAVMVGNTAFLRELGSLGSEQVAALSDLEAACETAIELAGHLQS